MVSTEWYANAKLYNPPTMKDAGRKLFPWIIVSLFQSSMMKERRKPELDLVVVSLDKRMTLFLSARKKGGNAWHQAGRWEQPGLPMKSKLRAGSFKPSLPFH